MGVGEIYLKVNGRWCYLYRAIDSAAATNDFLWPAFRDADAAKRLFRKALGGRTHPQRRATRLAPIYTRRYPLLRGRDSPPSLPHRRVQCLNNIIEQDIDSSDE